LEHNGWPNYFEEKAMNLFGKFLVLLSVQGTAWGALEITQNPIYLDNPVVGVPYLSCIDEFVGAENKEKVVYKKHSGPSWVTVTDYGCLTGMPKKEDLGEQVAVVAVSEGNAGLLVTVRFRVVEEDNDLLEWKKNPLRLPFALVDRAYFEPLAVSVKAPKGGPLTFEMVHGPKWLSLLPDGRLLGTPHQKDVGRHVFTVVVSDGEHSAETTAVLWVVNQWP
jgi:hypothetical protein